MSSGAITMYDALTWVIVTILIIIAFVMLMRSAQMYERALNLYWEGCKDVGVVRWSESINYSLLNSSRMVM